MRGRLALAVTLLVGLLAAITSFCQRATAHHGYTGRYNAARPVWVEGKVVAAYFGMPHPIVTIRVLEGLQVPGKQPIPTPGDVLDAGALEPVAVSESRDVVIELPPVRMFIELGNRVDVGDTLAVIAYRNCNEPFQLRGQWVRPASGPPVVRARRHQTEVDRC